MTLLVRGAHLKKAMAWRNKNIRELNPHQQAQFRDLQVDCKKGKGYITEFTAPIAYEVIGDAMEAGVFRLGEIDRVHALLAENSNQGVVYTSNHFKLGEEQQPILANIPAEVLRDNSYWRPEQNLDQLSPIYRPPQAFRKLRKGYNRFIIPPEKAAWDTPFPEYAPPTYTTSKNLRPELTVKSWRKWKSGNLHPRLIDAALRADIATKSYALRFLMFKQGMPVNYMGRTGLVGRGDWEFFGVVHTVDPVVTRLNRKTGLLEVALIFREDGGGWAIPGGKIDKGDSVAETASKEFSEEVGATIDVRGSDIVYIGYSDDPRDTDTSWGETIVIHHHLSAEQAPKVQLSAGSEADKVKWAPMTKENFGNLFSAHSSYLALVAHHFLEKKFELPSVTLERLEREVGVIT